MPLSPRGLDFSICPPPGGPGETGAHDPARRPGGQPYRRRPGNLAHPGRRVVLRGQRPPAGTKKAKPRQRGSASCSKEGREVSEVGFEKHLDPVEGDDVHPVVQVRMRGPGHDHQFLVVTAELLESILAEVT